MVELRLRIITCIRLVSKLCNYLRMVMFFNTCRLKFNMIMTQDTVRTEPKRPNICIPNRDQGELNHDKRSSRIMPKMMEMTGNPKLLYYS